MLLNVSNAMEEKIHFQSNEHSIEGLVSRGQGSRGVVITHPHPQYGGDMYNPVVESIAHVYQRKGITTLRFNFRGVGSSGGRYGDGIGEQADVLASVRCLRENGHNPIDLAGYSFGAWVNAHLDPVPVDIENMIMVSPPVAFMEFDANLALPPLCLVVSGSRDEIAPSGRIRNLMPGWNPEASFEEIQGADHFYFGFFKELEAVLSENI
jgi:alpha/beta superfamily hydrolase